MSETKEKLITETGQQGTALFSEDYVHRYRLTREIPQILAGPDSGRCLFIMLNPSTACAFKNDATIRKCISFAKGFQCHTLTVVNLFSFRATDPDRLKSADEPTNRTNDEIIDQELRHHTHMNDVRIAAWGSHPMAKTREAYIRHLSCRLDCLAKTKDGHPRHPLYLRGDSKLQMWCDSIF